MNSERIEAKIVGLLGNVGLEPRRDLRQRAIAAIVAARPTRVRTRRRLAAIAVGIAGVVLFALGFVPIPLGRAKGALDRAVAACEGASGLYIRSHDLHDGRDRVRETWYAAGGLERNDWWENGTLAGSDVMGADSRAVYDASKQVAQVDDFPPGTYRSPDFGHEKLQELAGSYLEQTPGSVEEWRKRSLWGGEVDVIDITLEAPGSQGKVKERYETDAATGRLLSLRTWEWDGGQWRLASYTDEVAWNVDLPSGTFAFLPPKGTKVTYYGWWKDRLDKTVAVGQTQDWRVRVHAVDVNEKGDLLLSLSRYPAPGIEQPDWKAVAVKIDAVDDLGVQYQDDMGDGRFQNSSWVTTLHRSTSTTRPSLAQTATVTIHFRASEPKTDQAVTLSDLPLPASRADLFEPDVVQY